MTKFSIVISDDLDIVNDFKKICSTTHLTCGQNDVLEYFRNLTCTANDLILIYLDKYPDIVDDIRLELSKRAARIRFRVDVGESRVYMK